MLVARAATRLGELCAELGEGLLDDGVPESAGPHFAEARRLAEEALALLPPEAGDAVVAAQVVHGWALVGLGEHAAAAGPLRAAVRITSATGDRAQLAAALLALGRALRRQGDGRGADEQLAKALALATEHGLPRLRRAALRELCTLHAELDDAGRALPYLQAYLADELDRVDERRTRWVELFGRRKSLLETERAAGQLRRQAYEDPLTHLPNRRYAEARLDGLLVGRHDARPRRRRHRPLQVDQRRDRPPRRRRRAADRGRPAHRGLPRHRRGVPVGRGRVRRPAARDHRRAGRAGAGADPPGGGRPRLGRARPGAAGHHQRRHRLGDPRRRPAHPLRRRRRRALRRQAQRPRPRRPAVGGHPGAPARPLDALFGPPRAPAADGGPVAAAAAPVEAAPPPAGVDATGSPRCCSSPRRPTSR